MGRLARTRRRWLVTAAFTVLYVPAAHATRTLVSTEGAIGLSLALGVVVAYLLSVGPVGGAAVAVVGTADAVVFGDASPTVAVTCGVGLAVAAVLCVGWLEARFRRHGPVRTAPVVLDFGLIAAGLLPLLLLAVDLGALALDGAAVERPVALLAGDTIGRSLGVVAVVPGLRMLLMRERIQLDRRTVAIVLTAAVAAAAASLGTLLVAGVDALVDAQLVIVPVLVLALLAGTSAYAISMFTMCVLVMGAVAVARPEVGFHLSVADHATWLAIAFGGMLLATEGDRRRAVTAQFESLFQTSATPTLRVSTRTGRIEVANPAVATLTGWSVLELRGRRLRDLLAEDADTEARCAALFAGSPSASSTVQVRTRSGELRFARCTGVLVQLGDHEVDVVQVQLVDLTDEQRRERELHRSNEALRSFGRRITHDLKQPLSAIAGYAGTLREHAERLDPALVTTMHERLDLAARRAVAQLDDVFAHAAVDGGRTEAVDIVASVASVRDVLSIDLAEAGGRIEVSPRVPTVHTERSVLHQVLLNLVTNSLKYGRPGEAPIVRVISRPRSGGVEVVVTDNGPGLGVDALEKVFERGSRLAPDRADGRGHGLADSRELAESLGGWLRAEPFAGGARFVLWLPDATARGEAAVRVLLVDDEPDDRLVLRARLGLEDQVEVVGEAATVGEAVSMTRALTPDIVVLDRWLAQRDGLLAVAEIARAHPDVRIVLLTADDSPDVAALARSGGVAATVSKADGDEDIVRQLVGAVTP